MVFAGYSGFLHHIQLASHELVTFGITVMKSKIPNLDAFGTNGLTSGGEKV